VTTQQAGSSGAGKGKGKKGEKNKRKARLVACIRRSEWTPHGPGAAFSSQLNAVLPLPLQWRVSAHPGGTVGGKSGTGAFTPL